MGVLGGGRRRLKELASPFVVCIGGRRLKKKCSALKKGKIGDEGCKIIFAGVAGKENEYKITSSTTGLTTTGTY